MDFRQGPPERGRAEAPTPRSSFCARERQAAARELGRGFCRHRRQGEGDAPEQDRFYWRRSVRRSRTSTPPSRSPTSSGQEYRRAPGRLDAPSDTSAAPSYLFNATVEGIDHADALLIIGSNPRWESPVLNARIRRRWRGRAISRSRVIGEHIDLTYSYDYLGAGPDTLAKIAKGEGFGEILAKAERPLILVGQGALWRAKTARPFRRSPRNSRAQVKGDWTGFSVLHTAASRVGALDIGFVPGEGGLDAQAMAKAGALDLLFLVGADEIDVEPGAFVVYVGSHGDRGAHRADVILPGAAYTEKSGTLCQYRRPGADDRPRRLPARRRPRGLGDFPRACRRRWERPLPFDSLSAIARQALCGAPAHRPYRRDRAARTRARWPRCRRRSGQGGLGLTDLGFLSDQPDRPRVESDGRMLGPRQRRGDRQAAE